MYYRMCPNPQSGGGTGEILSPELTYGSQRVVYEPNINFDIEPRNLRVEKYGTKWDPRLDKSNVLDFIQTADVGLLPEHLTPVLDIIDIKWDEVTRSLSLLNTETGMLTVINGFGFGRVEQREGRKIEYRVSPPDKNQRYNEYMENTRKVFDLGTTNITANGDVSSDKADGPLGGFTQEEVDWKIQQTNYTSKLLKKFPTVVGPTFLGAFKYKGEPPCVFGMVYERPADVDLFRTLLLTNDERINQCLALEYGFIRKLFDMGFVHNQMHSTNKGLATDGKFYIGDMESLMDIRRLTIPVQLSSKINALMTAIEHDLSNVLGIQDGEYIGLHHLNKPVFNDFLCLVTDAFLPEQPESDLARHKFLKYLEASLLKNREPEPERAEQAIITSIASMLIESAYSQQILENQEAILRMEQNRKYRINGKRLNKKGGDNR